MRGLSVLLIAKMFHFFVKHIIKNIKVTVVKFQFILSFRIRMQTKYAKKIENRTV